MSEDSFLEFPCDFPIKAVGHTAGDFENLVIEIVTRHAGKQAPDKIGRRPSKDGNYLSITCTIRADSREQLDALYAELTSHERILMVL